MGVDFYHQGNSVVSRGEFRQALEAWKEAWKGAWKRWGFSNLGSYPSGMARKSQVVQTKLTPNELNVHFYNQSDLGCSKSVSLV